MEGSSSLPGGKAMDPTIAPMPVKTVMEDHIGRMISLRIPCCFMTPAEDIASGKLARNTPTTKASNWPMDAVFTRMPMTTLSGTASIKMPSQIISAACLLPPSWAWPPSLPPPGCAVAWWLAHRSGSAWPVGSDRKASSSGSSSEASSASRATGASALRGTWAEAAPVQAGGASVRSQPNSSSNAPRPSFVGGAAPSGGSSSRVGAWALGALATSACRNRSSRSQSLSTSPRWMTSTVVRSSATAVAVTARACTRCSVPRSPFARTTWRARPSAARQPSPCRLPAETSTDPSTTKYIGHSASTS
mmetsp:Transcript_98897/g.268593  ORF Transcript_98897/g.268593 Transcript_98897/m.268593 type:complete len:304 (-) Transcript_98897:411-1322(-)